MAAERRVRVRIIGPLSYYDPSRGRCKQGQVCDMREYEAEQYEEQNLIEYVEDDAPNIPPVDKTKAPLKEVKEPEVPEREEEDDIKPSEMKYQELLDFAKDAGCEITGRPKKGELQAMLEKIDRWE